MQLTVLQFIFLEVESSNGHKEKLYEIMPIKSFVKKTTLCSLYHWNVFKFFKKEIKTLPKHALQIGSGKLTF